MVAEVEESSIDQIGDGAFSGAAEAGEPDDAAAVTEFGFSVRARDGVGMPDDMRIGVAHAGLLPFGEGVFDGLHDFAFAGGDGSPSEHPAGGFRDGVNFLDDTLAEHFGFASGEVFEEGASVFGPQSDHIGWGRAFEPIGEELAGGAVALHTLFGSGLLDEGGFFGFDAAIGPGDEDHGNEAEGESGLRADAGLEEGGREGAWLDTEGLCERFGIDFLAKLFDEFAI